MNRDLVYNRHVDCRIISMLYSTHLTLGEFLELIKLTTLSNESRDLIN